MDQDLLESAERRTLVESEDVEAHPLDRKRGEREHHRGKLRLGELVVECLVANIGFHEGIELPLQVGQAFHRATGEACNHGKGKPEGSDRPFPLTSSNLLAKRIQVALTERFLELGRCIQDPLSECVNNFETLGSRN
jgi:hypothetical protein